MKAVLCPVCQGEGELFDYTDIVKGEPGTKHMKLCRGCNGKGWVEVQESHIEAHEYTPFVDKCPACGGDRNSPGLTGCPLGSHYGSYSLGH